MTRLALGGSVLLLVTTIGTQVGTGPDAEDFPNFDAAALALQRSGFEARRAALALAESPDDPDTARLLAAERRVPDALSVLRRIVERHPDRIAAAFHRLDVYPFQADATTPHAADLLALTRVARTMLGALPREGQARAAFALIRVESQLDRSQSWADHLNAFVAEYTGTETAMLAEVDVINAGRLTPARLEALDAFARRHPGTPAAAKALYQKGWDLSHNGSALRIERREDDPTPRFKRTLEVVRELTSGRYPACEWVDRAPELITGFSTYEPKFSTAENLEAMLATYRAFVERELPRDPAHLPGSTLDFLITSKMGQLHELAGRDRVAGVEQELAAFERTSLQPGAVRLLRAQFYLRNLVEIPAQRDTLIARARATLEALAATGVEPFARRGLATLAALHFHERQYDAAISIHQRYLARYPTSDWAWVAMLRLGESQLAMGDVATAATTFASLATRDGVANFVRVLGHASAAEARASLGQVDDASRHAELALSLWDDDHGFVYRSHGRQAPRPGDEPFAPPRGTVDIEKAALPARIAELRQAASLPSGAAIERGRALIRNGRFSDARVLLERAARDGRGTALEPAARTLAHQARLEQALALANIESATRNDAAAIMELDELDALGADPLDFPVMAARVARATMGAIGSGAADADVLMASALDAWRTQQPLSPAPAAGSIEADLLAIRAVVFTPLGGGIYGNRRWNAFDFPVGLPRFLVVNPTVPVIMADGAVRRVTLRRPVAGLDNLLYLDDAQLAVMATMIRSLGGTGRRQPAQIMEMPNQPAGRAVDVRAYWNRFFPMRQGHWSGWVFETYPVIRDVTFQNAERTRAAVRVEVGYSGGTILLDKQQGVWRAIDIVNLWIT